MNIAFYAPLKSPDAATPSGDRRVARALVDALTFAGHRIDKVSRFRSFDGTGDPRRQERIRDLGRRLADRYLAGVYRNPAEPRPDCWFTYHLYYKAPDWIGPRISKVLGIPYFLAEASFAPKRAGGRWRMGHDAVAAALAWADGVIALNPADVACVQPLLRSGVATHRLAPFLTDLRDYSARPRQATRAELAGRSGVSTSATWLLCVAMMRSGDKYSSYDVLADTLARLKFTGWRLFIVGDGEAESRVRRLFEHRHEVTFIGRQTREELISWYRAADLFVWPAIREAFGMAALEAQAAGLPVAAGRTPGLAQIVEHNRTGVLTESGDSAALATAIDDLLFHPERRAAMAVAAQNKVADNHGIESAARTLHQAIRG